MGRDPNLNRLPAAFRMLSKIFAACSIFHSREDASETSVITD